MRCLTEIIPHWFVVSVAQSMLAVPRTLWHCTRLLAQVSEQCCNTCCGGMVYIHPPSCPPQIFAEPTFALATSSSGRNTSALVTEEHRGNAAAALTVLPGLGTPRVSHGTITASLTFCYTCVQSPRQLPFLA